MHTHLMVTRTLNSFVGYGLLPMTSLRLQGILSTLMAARSWTMAGLWATLNCRRCTKEVITTTRFSHRLGPTLPPTCRPSTSFSLVTSITYVLILSRSHKFHFCRYYQQSSSITHFPMVWAWDDVTAAGGWDVTKRYLAHN